MISLTDELAEWVGQDVVVDTSTPYLYIGEFQEATDTVLKLKDVDVQDISDLSSTKEVYLMSSARLGKRINRHSVWVRVAAVVSMSPLGDLLHD